MGGGPLLPAGASAPTFRVCFALEPDRAAALIGRLFKPNRLFFPTPPQHGFHLRSGPDWCRTGSSSEPLLPTLDKRLCRLSGTVDSMALMCRQILGSGAGSVGWVGLMVATATNDWVRTCDYSLTACLRMDELVSKGLWAECIVSPALYHCSAREQILALPGERLDVPSLFSLTSVVVKTVCLPVCLSVG